MTTEQTSHDHIVHAGLAVIVAMLDVIDAMPVVPAVVALGSALTSLAMHYLAHSKRKGR